MARPTLRGSGGSGVNILVVFQANHQDVHPAPLYLAAGRR